jgi:hypothetical protein
MGRGTVRSGAPATGTRAVDGTDDSLTLPRVITFDPPVRPCIVTHHGTNDELLVKVNTEVLGVTTVTETFSQDNGLGHFVLPPKNTDFLADASDGPPTGSANHVDVSCGGQVAVHSVAFCTTHASDDLDDVSVIGFSP